MKNLAALVLISVVGLAGCAFIPTNPTPRPTAPVAALPTTTPIHMAENTLAVYHKSGGIAGITEILTVYTDGNLDLFASWKNSRGQATVDPARLAKLQNLLTSPAYNNLQASYQADGADLFTYRVTTRTSDGKTRTVTTMDAAKHPEIFGQVIAELNALRTLVK